ncbi:MAG: DHA2 family efflux MFS transporter permease subunit [bacterium]
MEPPPQAEGREEGVLPVAERRLVTFAVIFGAFVSIMDVSVVSVSLPHMMGAFGADLSSITWVGTSYSIAQIIMITMTSWWSTLLGRKRFYLFSFTLFTLGSILSGTAQTFEQMLAYRVIQGLGAGSLIPISQSILRESYPPRLHGMAMAMFGMGIVLAPTVGPVLGGWLTEEYGWPWIFYINIPFCVAGMLLVSAYVKDPPYLKRGIQKVDWGGIALLVIGLTAMQLVLERGQEENWFDSDWITAGIVVTVLAVILLVYWELQVAEPVVDFRVLRNVPLIVGSSISLVFGIAMFGTMLLIPQFLQTLLDYSPMDSGMVLLPRGLVMFMVMAIVGRLFNLVDSRILVGMGLCLVIYSFFLFAHLSLDAGFWNLAAPLIISGLGMPFVFVTLSAVSLGSVRPEKVTSAASLYNLSRRVGGNIGYALLTTLIERRFAFHRVGLISNVSDLNEMYLQYKAGLESALIRQQIDPFSAQTKALALIDTMVNRHSTMLAYNDVYWFLMLLFAATLPLVVLLGKRERPR